MSATTVTVIAFDRYFTIVYRERHQSGGPRPARRPAGGGAGGLNRQNYCQVGIETCIIWIVGIMCGLPVSMFQVVVKFPQYSDEYIKCIEDWPRTLKAAYSVTILLVQCVMPSVALSVTGRAITSHLKRVAGLLSGPRPGATPASRPATPAVTAASTEIVVTAPTDSSSSLAASEAGRTMTTRLQTGNNNISGSNAATSTRASNTALGPVAADCHQRNVERNQSVTRTLLAVSISFTVCWMPLHILNALIDVGLVTHETLSEHGIYLMIAVCSCVAMTSVPLNALLYGWYNPSINREVITWRLIACAVGGSGEPDVQSAGHNNLNNNNNTASGVVSHQVTSTNPESQVNQVPASVHAVRDSRVSCASDPAAASSGQSITSI